MKSAAQITTPCAGPASFDATIATTAAANTGGAQPPREPCARDNQVTPSAIAGMMNAR